MGGCGNEGASRFLPLAVTPSVTPSATSVPYPSSTPAPTPWPTPTPEPVDTGWQLLSAGIELRQLNLNVPVETPPSSDDATATSVVERLTIVRLDPAQVRFQVHCDSVAPHPVSTWAHYLDAMLVVNGGYFTPENEPLGLLVSDGETWGHSYDDFAGMFAVTSNGEVGVRWLRHRPYSPDESLQEALQSFPVLVKPGGVMGFPAEADDGRPARRTVVAQDVQGRILFIAAPRGYLSLHRLAHFLSASDLGIDVALNLDGGFSTGLWLDAAQAVHIDSLTPVPVVISVVAAE